MDGANEGLLRSETVTSHQLGSNFFRECCGSSFRLGEEKHRIGAVLGLPTVGAGEVDEEGGLSSSGPAHHLVGDRIGDGCTGSRKQRSSSTGPLTRGVMLPCGGTEQRHMEGIIGEGGWFRHAASRSYCCNICGHCTTCTDTQ